jgi:hypothetical protein
MLTRIEALRYRSLRHVSRPLSRFHTLVGPNGAGKSSFLDVVALVGDVLRVGPRKAILGDGIQVAPRTADPLHLCWMREGGSFELALELSIPAERRRSPGNGKHDRARYEMCVESGGPNGAIRLAIETFWLCPSTRVRSELPRELFPDPSSPPDHIVHQPYKHAAPGWKKVVSKNAESGTDNFYSETTAWQNPFRLGPERSALANLPEDEERFPAATWAKRFLMEGIQRVVLSAEAMRRPSPPGSPTRFLPDGSNLPWVVDALSKEHPEHFERWLEHVRTAIPDLRNVTVVERDEDRHRYLVVEYTSGLRAPSWVVSDGTLRLFALTLIAYLPNIEGIILIEEPENGIHPKAVEAVFQSLSSVYGAQVLCASHSPLVLGLARPEDLLCFAKDLSGATDVISGTDHPRLRDWRGDVDLGTLFASGVLG